MKFLINYRLISIVMIIFSGCATTSINYNKETKELILTNNDKKTIIPNIELDYTTHDMTVMQNKGSSVVTRYKSTSNSLCNRITLYEYLPLGMNRWYTSNVKDNLEHKFNVEVEKKDQFYKIEKNNKIAIGFDGGMNAHGPSSKTFIEMNSACLNKDLNNDTIKNDGIVNYLGNYKIEQYKEPNIVKINEKLTKVYYHDTNIGKGGTSPWGNGGISHTPKMGVLFNVPYKSYFINAIEFEIKNKSGKVQYFNTYIYKKSGKNMYNKEIVNVKKQKIESFYDRQKIKVKIPKIIVEGEEIFVVIEWETKPLSDQRGQNSFFVERDYKINYNTSFYKQYKNRGWRKMKKGEPMISLIIEDTVK